MTRWTQNDRGDADPLGELLRLADAPEISPERVARHKALARDHWRRKVKARARRRRLGYGLAAAAALALALGLWRMIDGDVSPIIAGRAEDVAPRGQRLDASATAPVARLSVLAGPVRRGDDAAGTPLDAGAQVAVGAVLETGAGSRAAFQLAAGHELRLDVETRLRLVSDRVLALERGAVYVDSRGAPGSLEIRTALGTARDVGTRFEVRLADGGLKVRVRAGVVEVDRDGGRHRASAGAELTVGADGTLARRAIDVYGREWRWSLEVAPAFDIEGRSLREFLDWVTRETGWRLRVAEAVAGGAGAVTLNGSIAGLAPDEALDVVLPTTGLRHRVEGRELVVEPLE